MASQSMSIYISNLHLVAYFYTQIPKYLMEKWTSIDAEDVHLATIRVYHNAKSSTGKKPKIVLILPPDDGGEKCDEFELDMVNESVENQIVVAEREKEPGTGSRARTTILTGRVKHECNLRPSLLSRSYRQRIRERTQRANMPIRTIKRIEDSHPGGRGSINMLTSGVTSTSGFSDLVVRAPLSVEPADTDVTGLHRSQNQKFRRASSSGWLVCLAISSWICYLASSENENTGLSDFFESALSNLKLI